MFLSILLLCRRCVHYAEMRYWLTYRFMLLLNASDCPQ